MCLAWGNFGERGDPEKYNNQEGCELIEQGEIVNRTWEERQNSPSDAEAVEGMGPISAHKGEHLMPTDRGIVLYRRKIRQLIQDLTNGKRMPQPQQIPGEVVRTNGQDTVLFIPQNNHNDDRKFLKTVGSTVLELQFESENMSLKERDNHIINELSKMEKNKNL